MQLSTKSTRSFPRSLPKTELTLDVPPSLVSSDSKTIQEKLLLKLAVFRAHRSMESHKEKSMTETALLKKRRETESRLPMTTRGNRSDKLERMIVKAVSLTFRLHLWAITDVWVALVFSLSSIV